QDVPQGHDGRAHSRLGLVREGLAREQVLHPGEDPGGEGAHAEVPARREPRRGRPHRAQAYRVQVADRARHGALGAARPGSGAHLTMAKRRRKHIPLTERLASALADKLFPHERQLLRERRVEAKEVIRLFTPDHIMLHAWGGEDKWWNIDMSRRGPE